LLIVPPELVDKVHLSRTAVKRTAIRQWVPPVVAVQQLLRARVVLLRHRRMAKDADMFLVPLRPLQIPIPASRENVKALRRRVREAGVAKGGHAFGSAAIVPVLKIDDGEVPNGDSVAPTTAVEPLDPVQKKIRNLSKKLKAIDELKARAVRGERLEATQLKKIESEAEIQKDLAALSLTS